MIQTQEHKKYLKYALENVKREIYIQSPWIRNKILEIYKNDIINCLNKGIKVFIKYGLKPINRFDKVGIDKKEEEFFDDLKAKYPNHFYLKKDNDHSKIVICDDEFMIIGSFNWLSFGGDKDKEGDLRGESSTINTNKNEIEKQQEKFK